VWMRTTDFHLASEPVSGLSTDLFSSIKVVYELDPVFLNILFPLPVKEAL